MSTGFLIEPTPDVVVVAVTDVSNPIPVVTPDVTPIELSGGETKIVTAPEGPMGPQGPQGLQGPQGVPGATPVVEDISLNGGNF